MKEQLKYKSYLMEKRIHQQIKELSVKEGITIRELLKRALTSYLLSIENDED